MPLTIERDGQAVEVFTAEDLEAQVREAQAAVRREIEENPNGIAAAARREAERKQREAEQRLQQLEAQLAEAGTASVTEIERAKSAFAQDLRLIENGGIKPGRLAQVKALLAVNGVDVANDDAIAGALGELKTEAPGLFVDGAPRGYTPNGGSMNPPKSTQLSREERAHLPMEEYIRLRSEEAQQKG